MESQCKECGTRHDGRLKSADERACDWFRCRNHACNNIIATALQAKCLAEAGL